MEQLVFTETACNRVQAVCSKYAHEAGGKLKSTTDALCNTVLSDTTKARGILDSDENSILTLLLRGAQHNIDVDTFRKQCKSVSIPDAIAEVYENRYGELRDLVSTIGWRPPEIVDIDWRITRQLETSLSGTRCDNPLYVITLKVCECGSTQLSDVTFYASLEELQDLVWRLKEANAAVNKMASTAIR